MSDLLIASDNQEASSEQWEPESIHILSNRDRDIFLALMGADSEPTEAAKKATARFKKDWHDGEVYHFQTSARSSYAGAASDG